MKLVAHVKSIAIYPVKSMRGIAAEEAELYWYGLIGDRRYGFVQADNFQRFPWLTARELPDLVRYLPQFESDAVSDRESSPVQVLSPDGMSYGITDPALSIRLAAAWGKPIRLMQLNRGMFDAAPISLMSTATVASLAEAYAGDLDERRFRQNLILQPIDQAAPSYIEDQWNNRTLRFGADPNQEGCEILLHRPIARCQLINVDPETGLRDPAVLKAVNKNRDHCAGMYAWPRKLGKIKVGDPVYLGET